MWFSHSIMWLARKLSENLERIHAWECFSYNCLWWFSFCSIRLLQINLFKAISKKFDNVISISKDPPELSAWDNDWSLSGIRQLTLLDSELYSTFAHLPYVKCLTHPEELFGIAILSIWCGGVTLSRQTLRERAQGAWFGPNAASGAIPLIWPKNGC